MAKRKTEDSIGAPERKATKQEDMKSSSPPNESSDRPEAEAQASDPQGDPSVQEVRRSRRLNKESKESKASNESNESNEAKEGTKTNETNEGNEGNEAKEGTEIKDAEASEEEPWHVAYMRRIEKLLKSDCKMLEVMPRPGQDPTYWFKAGERQNPIYWSTHDLLYTYPKELGKLVQEMVHQISFVAEQHVVDNPAIMDERLSCEQKEQIIESLDGYCEQISWDGLLELLHPALRPSLPRFLFRAMMGKQLFEMIQDPFYWVCQENGKVDVPGQEDLFYPSRAEMRNLYKWFQRVGEWDAYAWRATTVQQLICGMPDESDCRQLGMKLEELRKARIEEYLASLVEPSSPLYPFLIHHEEEIPKIYRYWNLKKAVTLAMEISLIIGRKLWHIHHQPFSMLQHYHEDTDMITLDPAHWYGEAAWYDRNKVVPPPYRGILFMMCPALTKHTINGMDDRIKKEQVTPAIVIASKEAPLGVVAACILDQESN